MPSRTTKDFVPTVAANIKLARQEKGMTQKEFGAAINGLDALAVSRWERGKSLPSRENLQALAELTGREVAWFYSADKEAA